MRTPNPRTPRVPHWVDQNESWDENPETAWVDRQQRSPPSQPPRSSKGSNIAARIPRPSSRSAEPPVVVVEAPASSDRALRVLSLGAAASSIALLGTGLLAGTVIVLALTVGPNATTGATTREAEGPTAQNGGAPRSAPGAVASSAPQGSSSAAGAAVPPLGQPLTASSAGSPASSAPDAALPPSSGRGTLPPLAADDGLDPVRSAPPRPPAQGSWMDRLTDVGNSLTTLVSGEPAPAPRAAPAMAPGTSLAPVQGLPQPATAGGPIAADDGLQQVGATVDRSGGFGTAAPANDPALQMLAGLDEPAAPAAPAPSGGDSWMDTLSDVGSSLTALVTGAPPPAPARPAAPSIAAGTPAPSVARGPIAPISSGPLAADDGLDQLGVGTDRSGGFGTAAQANDPAVQRLAGLDDPISNPTASAGVGAPVGSAPVGSAATGSAPVGSAALRSAGDGPPPPPSSVVTAAPAAEEGWLDTLSDMGSSLTAMLTGAPAPSVAPDPSLAAGAPTGPSAARTTTRAPSLAAAPPADRASLAGVVGPITADDGLDALAAPPPPRPVDPNDPAMRMLADLDAPTSGAAPAAAPAPAASGGDDWLDTLSDVGSSLASMVLEPTPRDPGPASAPAAPKMAPGTAVPSLAAVPSGPLAVDDGLEAAVAPGAPSPGPALQTLAALQGTTGPSAAAAAARPPAAPAAAPAEDGGWLDSLASVGSSLGSLIPSVSIGGGGGGGPISADDGLDSIAVGAPPPPPSPDDPAQRMLAELDQPLAPGARPAPPSAAAPAEDDSWLGTLSSLGQSVASAFSPPPPPSLEPLPPPPSDPTTVRAAADDGWYASLQAGGAPTPVVAAGLAGGPAPSGSTPSLSEIDGRTTGASAATVDQWSNPVAATGGPAAAARPGTSEGRPGVDLLADDDGLSDLDTRTADKTGGFGTQGAGDDAAARMLADLDAPLAAPGRPAPTTVQDDSWLGTLSSIGSAVLGTTPAPGPAMAPGTGTDDGLDTIVAEGAPTRPGGDPALAVLASLDQPTAAQDDSWIGTLGSTVVSIVSGTPSAPPKMAPGTGGPGAPPPSGITTARPAVDDGWLATVSAMGSSIASYVSGTPANAPSVVNDGPSLSEILASNAPSAARTGSMRPGAPAPSASVDFSQVTSAGPRIGDASSSFRIAAPPATGDGCPDELCGDAGLIRWSDPTAGQGALLQVDDAFTEVQMPGGQSTAGFFYDPSDDPSPVVLDPPESDLVTLRVRVDANEIPIEVDGRPIGLAPLTTRVAPGSHIVKLYMGSQPTGFMVNVGSSGDSEWCFEARGRSFRNVRCP